MAAVDAPKIAPLVEKLKKCNNCSKIIFDNRIMSLSGETTLFLTFILVLILIICLIFFIY